MVELLIFSLEKSVYRPGETIRGKLIIKTNSIVKVTSISIHFDGSSSVSWAIVDGQYSKSYKNYVKHVEQSLLFSNNNEEFILNGEFSCPFEIQIPFDIPSSLNHYTTYYIHACIDIPWRFNKKIKRAVKILKPIDLNMYPHLKESVTIEDTKMIFSILDKPFPVTIRLSIAKSGFIAGENILFDAFIDNPSSKKFKVYFKLISITELFSSDGLTKENSINIAKTYFPLEIMKQSSEKWTNGALAIPMGTPSSNTTCEVVKLFYFVVLGIKQKEMFAPTFFDVRIPITIGTTSFSD